MNGKKLHLGCGRRHLKGYVHVDLADFPHIDYQHDVKTLPMFENGSADLIYSSHTIEYFDRFEILDVLKEWFRVLKKGGILRLAVPDFEALVKVYCDHGTLDMILGPLFGRWEVAGSDLVIYHKTTYDFDSLRQVLETVGYRDIKRWDWRKVFVGDLEDYDDYSQAYIPHMDKDNGQLISLNVEALK
jgi:ubiquinone/menaquinone biosynthesis C-methylase UbiE